MPKNNPTVASENATGNPISMKRIMTPNISGGMMPKSNIVQIPCASALLQRSFVFRFEANESAQRRSALHEFGGPLKEQQDKAKWQHPLHRPKDQATGVIRNFLLLERG